ncbi:EAL domain-containing protein [Laspinema sp. A4]|uniref:sensor domain-containing protein n=1 Tax=Laspinema sp. D2d TaxID=2953686 RepID=UPI0021BA8D05|nr:EAL domain-containing protein [Laspinema sp. D2d]MCT7984895.1 EAL domain-containing protein [Laspinema sp. D2d]
MLTQCRGGEIEMVERYSNPPTTSSAIASLQSVSQRMSIAVTLIGLIVLLGWIFNIPALKSVWPGLVTMKANTAISFILCGLSLWQLGRKNSRSQNNLSPHNRQRILNKKGRGFLKPLVYLGVSILSTLSYFPIFIGVLTLFQYILNVNLGIDQWLFEETANAVGTSIPGRMAPNTAFNFILLGWALVLSQKKRYPMAQYLSVIAWAIGFLGLLGYLYGISAFYGLGRSTEMALHTSVGFILLSVGILLANPDRGPVALLTSDRTLRLLMQPLAIAALVLPPLLGGLILQGTQLNLYDRGVGIALLSVFNTLLLATAIGWNAHTLSIMDARREQAERERYLSAIAAARSEELQKTLIELQQAQAEQKQAEQKYRSIFENAVEGIFQSTLNGRYITVNPMLAQIYGYDGPEELINKVNNIEYQIYVDKNRRTQFVHLLQKSNAFWNFESQVYRKDGSIIWISENARVIRNSEGKIIGYEGTVEDITQRKQAEERLENSLSLLQATLESTADGIFAIDQKGCITSYNQKFIELLNISPYWLEKGTFKQGLKILLPQLKKPQDCLSQIRKWWDSPNLEFWDTLEFKEGRILECYSRPQMVGNSTVGRVFSFRDITDATRAEQHIRYQAFHDSLTDLPNRNLLNECLVEVLEEAKNSSTRVAVMFLDLDRFKTINDTLGHAIGDKVLQGVAARLKATLGDPDIIARWGGDEFTIILPQVSSRVAATKIAEQIIQTLKPAFSIENHHLHISTSIGIALYPQDGEDGETLIKHADSALYRAKEKGRNTYEIYTPSLDILASELLELENRLHRALDRGEFLLNFQPKVNIKTGEIKGMEALVRWNHPELGLVSPAKFIPLAEETGLIMPIGEWVLKTACRQNKAWIDSGLSAIPVAVNLSVRQFQQPGLVQNIAQVLEETGLEAQYLTLEITETAAMLNVDFTRQLLRELEQMGVNIALDDFGTGYSSLSYLKQFPLHTLKIDRSFVKDLTVEPADIAIARAVIALGHGLHLNVVAEGVETQEQLDCLRMLDCEEIQGYFFSPPLSSEEATQLLQGISLQQEVSI